MGRLEQGEESLKQSEPFYPCLVVLVVTIGWLIWADVDSPNFKHEQSLGITVGYVDILKLINTSIQGE